MDVGVAGTLVGVPVPTTSPASVMIGTIYAAIEPDPVFLATVDNDTALCPEIDAVHDF